MRFNSKTSAALMGSVCAAALSWSSVASADPVEPNVSMIDYRLDLDLDYIAISLNMNAVEGALGATNLEINQTALAQLGNAAGRIDAGTFLAINQEQLSGDDYEYGDIAQIAINLAAAATTQLDSKLGGNQIAVASFNTATFDVADNDTIDGGTGTVALIQSLVNDDQYGGNYGNADVSVNLIAGNFMDAATTYAGTAVIDAEMANPDYLALADRGEGYDTLTPETINGLQQAAVSLNTLRGTADDGTTAQIDLFGQNLDTTALYDPENAGSYGETTFLASASNQAIAYSPRPADSRFVAPELVNDLNDPKVSNLDQVAAISLNTISLGVTDGTADFVIYAQDETDSSLLSSGISASGDVWGNAQTAYFSDTTEDSDSIRGDGDIYGKELFLSNTVVATTLDHVYQYHSDEDGPLGIGADSYYYVGGEGYNADSEDGIGHVALEDVSQVAALTINSISQAGEGALTLKAGNNYSSDADETSLNGQFTDRDDFVQGVMFLDIDANRDYYLAGDDVNYVFGIDDLGSAGGYTGAINFAYAETDEGNVNVDTLSQTLQLGLNSISSQGDLNGWNGTDDDAGIGQAYVASIALNAGNKLDTENDVNAQADNGTVNVSTVDQMVNLSFNTVSVGGDMTANLEQMPYSAEFTFDDDLNQMYVDNDDEGSAAADEISQVASLRMNTVNVTGDIDSNNLHQHLDDLAGVYFGDGLNDFDAETENGNVTVDGVDQVAMLNLNSVAGADIAAGLVQTAANLEYFSWDEFPRNNVNDLEVEAEDTGNASLANASQVSVLNINTVAASGVLSGSVDQVSQSNIAGILEDIGPYSLATNYVDVRAEQDLNGARNVGGNASLDGMVQTASYNVNTISAAGLSNAYISQTLEETFSVQSNVVGVDAEWGVASATGAVQTAINRANYMSISAPVVAVPE